MAFPDRRTKIVATIGPASSQAEVLAGLIEAGMDGARLNFSHGTHDEHGASAALIREAQAACGRPLAVIADLQDDLVPRIVSTVADLHGVLPRSMGDAVRNRAADELSPYEAVLRSFGYFSRVTAEELAAARTGLEAAVRKAPGHADAWAMRRFVVCIRSEPMLSATARLLVQHLEQAARSTNRSRQPGPRQ